MRKTFLVICVVAASTLAASAPGARADTTVATPDGRIMTSSDAATLGLQTAPVPAPVVIDGYAFSDEAVTALADPLTTSGSMSSTFWGYEGNTSASRLFAYTGYPSGPVTPTASCVPALTGGAGLTGDGRGVAFDPLTGDLWISRVTFPTFAGDGKLYLVAPPTLFSSSCPEVREILVHAKPGQTVQDDFGALDVDEATKHIWAAGYKPVNGNSYIYLIDQKSGLMTQSCWVPFRGGGVGNDTLAIYRNANLPQRSSSRYLITDAGGSGLNSYEVIDQSDCHNGRQVTPVAVVGQSNPLGATGIDVEWGGMLNTDLATFHNQG